MHGMQVLHDLLPFEIPKFEYDSANPRVKKCQLCYSRLKENKLPACVEACPREALLFGTRRAVMDIAKERIYQNPGKYVRQIYGEREVGGTGWIYLSKAPFSEIGFRTDLSEIPVPDRTKGFLFGVAQVLLIWPVFLLGLSMARKKKEGGSEGKE